MKKLAILASVVMIVTAPIMAQQAATPSQEELGLWDIAKEYGSVPLDKDSKKPAEKGIFWPSQQTAPAPAATAPATPAKSEPAKKDAPKADAKAAPAK